MTPARLLDFVPYHTEDLADRARAVLPADRAPAVVFSGHITGLAVARSLGRRGVPCVVLDRHANGVALASRHATLAGAVPNPTEEEAAFVERLVELGEALPQKGVLFPTNDDWLLAALRHRSRLERHYHFPVSGLENVERILNKVELYREAERLGIPIPASHELTDETWEKVRDTVRYPLILKPAHQRPFYDAFQVKVYRVDTPQEFEAFWRRTRPHALVAQEIVPPERATFYSLGSYAGRDHRLHGAFVGRKLEQFPAGFGTACLVEGVEAPEIVERGARLLQTLRFHGVSEIEYIHDSADGEYKLIDVNTRVWKWIGLPIAAGADLPWLAYQDALGALDASAVSGGAPSPPGLPLRWVYARDYIRLKSEQAGTCNDTGDHLSDAEWSAILTGRYGVQTGIVEAVHDPDDPAPSVRLVKNLFHSDSYYCPC